MKRHITILSILIAGVLASSNLNAQTPAEGETPNEAPPMPRERPSVYDMTVEVREALSLDHKEFDKVYSAYEKYNKSVFGDVKNTPTGRPGGRPGGGGPGGGGPGGMGRPGGGGPQGGFGGGPQGGMGGPGNRPTGEFTPKDKPKDIDPEKLEKAKAKAEEKLCKSIKKIFKKNPEKYEHWSKLRIEQLKRLFPEPPHQPFTHE